MSSPFVVPAQSHYVAWPNARVKPTRQVCSWWHGSRDSVIVDGEQVYIPSEIECKVCPQGTWNFHAFVPLEELWQQMVDHLGGFHGVLPQCGYRAPRARS